MSKPEQSAAAALRMWYRHHGYLRRPLAWRIRAGEDRPDDWQVCFLVKSVVDLRQLRSALAKVGFHLPPALRRFGYHWQNLTGQANQQRFLNLL